MLRNKRILLIIILAVALFLIPNMCNAAEITATQTTQTSDGVTVKWKYELDEESGTIVGLRCSNTAEVTGSVEIPSEIDGYKVVTIGNGDWDGGIFYKCSGLTGVTIPNTVTTIELGSFEDCVGLSSVTIPNNVTLIGEYAFRGCSGLSSITLSEKLSTIEYDAFNGCTGMVSLTLPNKLTSIGSRAFKDCSGITSLVIPDSVTKIDEDAFYGCSGIVDLTISKNLTKLNGNVFAYCSGLKSVIIPDKVTTICGGYSWDGAFYKCTKLEKVLIPDTVATIEDCAFYDCHSNLTIYGNDGKTSKRYAEANNINFDYIANWDNAAVGDDVTPPKLKTLEIQNSSLFKYDEGTEYYLAAAGTNISIKATFEEIIYGDAAPTLTIKCGNGENITLTNGVIQGEFIVYTYTIKNTDKGIISAVSMTGGDIKDKTGNLAKEYTCPKLTTSYIIGENFVFANGTDSIIENEGNNNQNQGTTVTLSSIAITKTPTRNTYTEGSSFEKTGMVVTATYSDGSIKEITNYTISPSGELKSSDTKVVISYTENGVTKTVEQKITVIAKGANNNDSNSSNNSNFKNDTIKDTTIKNDNKLPQTGTTVLTLALISLIAVAVVSKVKCGKYKDI